MGKIVDCEVEGVRLQTKIKGLLGRPVTKAEAQEALQLHLNGDGGNTVGWKYDAKVNKGKIELGWKEHNVLGDAIIDLGRLVHHYPELEFCFP